MDVNERITRTFRECSAAAASGPIGFFGPGQLKIKRFNHEGCEDHEESKDSRMHDDDAPYWRISSSYTFVIFVVQSAVLRTTTVVVQAG
jgi:hypothetical protein